MKIRNGFVSNSSSSSFIIYGAKITEKKLCEKFNIDDKEDIYDVIDNLLSTSLKDTELKYYCDYEDGHVYIGKPWTKIKDDETGGQFKESISNKLTELFGELPNIRTYEEIIYN